MHGLTTGRLLVLLAQYNNSSLFLNNESGIIAKYSPFFTVDSEFIPEKFQFLTENDIKLLQPNSLLVLIVPPFIVSSQSLGASLMSSSNSEDEPETIYAAVTSEESEVINDSNNE